jgi:hypothetical protein
MSDKQEPFEILFFGRSKIRKMEVKEVQEVNEVRNYPYIIENAVLKTPLPPLHSLPSLPPFFVTLNLQKLLYG